MYLFDKKTVTKLMSLHYDCLTPFDAVIGVPFSKNGTPIAYLQQQVNQHHIDFYQRRVFKTNYVIENKTFTQKHRVVNVFRCLLKKVDTFD